MFFMPPDATVKMLNYFGSKRTKAESKQVAIALTERRDATINVGNKDAIPAQNVLSVAASTASSESVKAPSTVVADPPRP